MASCTSHGVKSERRNSVELADILRRYLPGYLTTHDISLWQQKILYDIQICRTAACGAHLEICDYCSYEQPAYDSCHNRHCPKCQGIARRRWVSARLEELLPVPYYHVVFTLPHRLNDIVLYNKQLLYNMFYRAAAYTCEKWRVTHHSGTDSASNFAWSGHESSYLEAKIAASAGFGANSKVMRIEFSCRSCYC